MIDNINKNMVKRHHTVKLQNSFFNGTMRAATFRATTSHSQEELQGLQQSTEMTRFTFLPDEHDNLTIKEAFKTQIMEMVAYLEGRKIHQEGSERGEDGVVANGAGGSGLQVHRSDDRDPRCARQGGQDRDPHSVSSRAITFNNNHPKKKKKKSIRIIGDVLTYMRILSAKGLRASEDTEEGRLSQVLPGLGMFHFMWEVLKLILGHWWGDQTSPGTLSWLKASQGHQYVSKDGAKFSYCDEFLHEATHIKLLEGFRMVTGKELADLTAEDIDTMMTFIFTPQQDPAKVYLASFLQEQDFSTKR